ncbi:MAG: bifunctional homocysteine S-methyltransferase/methylenetetrahydrofolate reductase [Bdellovibrionales bacterium]|nr:bifunctional homocysteine S-methyltransferase/methylenetetrahydrofolate reductase [Bdellovibrionales bacterium]
MSSPRNSIFLPGTLFDGGLGTELYERGFYINRPFEELNLSAPADVESVHRDYLDSGAKFLTLNTFAATRVQLKEFDLDTKLPEIVEAAVRIANNARREFSAAKGSGGSKDSPRLAFSMGPLGVLVEPLGSFGLDEARREFADVAKIAAENAAKNPRTHAYDAYIFETFTNLSELEAAVDGVRSVDRERPIVASISVKSSQKDLIAKFAERFGSRDDVDALGLNCSEGPADLYATLKILRPLTTKAIIVQPNAGTPRHLNGRYFYMTSPDYMAKFAKRFVEAGATGVGGCCGTGPDHIRAMGLALKMTTVQSSGTARVETVAARDRAAEWKRLTLAERPASSIGESLAAGKKVHTVELIPPKGTDTTKFFEHVNLLAAAGVRHVNIPDGARAMTRVGSLHLAALVQNVTKGKVRAVPHFTTRDRNLIALQSDLLGAAVNGLGDVLIVTGDPPKLGNNRDASAVYDIDSIGLTYLVDCLNRGVTTQGEALGSRTGFGIGVAANPTAINLEVEKKRFRYKVESGADYAFTQPIFDPESFLRWRDDLGKNYIPHVVGIWPLISLRNAEFMANEVPGVSVPEWVVDEMEKAGDDPTEAVKRGTAIAVGVMEKLEKSCEGFCVSAPVGRAAVALDALRSFL